MVSKCFQAYVKNDNSSAKQREEQLLIQRLKEQVLKLQEEIKMEKEVNANLVELLYKKSDEHETELMKYRIDNINANGSLIQNLASNNNLRDLKDLEQSTLKALR